MSSQCLDTGIQPLLCSHLVEIKSSGSQCLGTGMTPFFFLDPSVKHWDDERGDLE
ncbi:hypothetical protein [Wolbachia endosymbiont (group A) of Agelastica alni]|uniref:hypothetical protein n=1 Tax=Wolbachia endosymbiont (group A) of Agelastica alni TaxID=3066130 RepID=UPI003132DEDD